MSGAAGGTGPAPDAGVAGATGGPDAPTGTVLVVDAANVVGSRPDGWWRDRAGAAARLVASLVALVRTDPPPSVSDAGAVVHVVVVLEGAARAAGDADDPGVEVVRAERDGDGAVVAVVERLRGAGAETLVVTSDRGLRERVLPLGAQVRGAGWLRDLLDARTGSP